MSLQIWLPLNGTMKNQGLLGDLTQTATPTYDIGKTGQALVTGGCKMSAEQASQVLNNNEFSICFWVYVNADTGTTVSNMFFGNNAYDSTANNRKYTLFQYPTVNDLHWSWQNNTSVTFTNGILSGVLPSYEWTHVVVTYKNPNGTIYINGAKVKEFTGVSDSSSFAYETNVIRDKSDGTRMLNDYRIYDNCLSAKEVKEISKALVLHYKLGGYGGENLIKGNFNCTSTKDKYVTSGSVVCTLTAQDILDNRGKTLTFSYRVKSDGSSTSIVTDYRATRFGLHGNIQWVDSNGNSFTQWPFSDLLSCGKSEGVYSCKWTIPNSIESITSTLGFSVQTDPASGFAKPADDNNETWYLKDVKLEWGDKATSWCPNREDALYTTLGFNDGIERDCSGMGNDGTMSGTFLWNSDSARHEGSYIFTNSPAQFIYRPYLSFLTGPFTVSCWCYQTNVNTTHGSGTIAVQFIVSQGRNYLPDSTASYGFNITTHGGDIIAYVGRSTLNSGISALNVWRMCTLVYDGTKAYLYIDGVLQLSAIVTSPTYENSSYAFVVGKMSCSYTSTEYFFPFVGNISDVRIYATALSASDVKALYDNTISIDKNGNIHAYDFKEE